MVQDHERAPCRGLDKATNVVPLLKGLAAMGTAPTRHLGVALAAGLGAGARKLLSDAAGSADLRQRQIQNQMAQTGLDVYRGVLQQAGAPQSAPQPSPSAQQPIEGPPTDQSKYAPYYQQKYAVNPAMTDQELANITRAKVAAGITHNPGIADAANLPYLNRIKAQTFKNQQQAQLEREQYYVAYQQATASGDQVGAADPAAHVNAIHPWTGDTYVNDAGSMRNNRTLEPMIGAVAQTLTPEQQAQIETTRRGQNIGALSIEKDENGTPWVINKMAGGAPGGTRIRQATP